MGSDGELCYENPASTSQTSSLAARGQREEGNGHDKDEGTKKNSGSERRFTWTDTVAAGEFCK